MIIPLMMVLKIRILTRMVLLVVLDCIRYYQMLYRWYQYIQVRYIDLDFCGNFGWQFPSLDLSIGYIGLIVSQQTMFFRYTQMFKQTHLPMQKSKESWQQQKKRHLFGGAVPLVICRTIQNHSDCHSVREYNKTIHNI